MPSDPPPPPSPSLATRLTISVGIVPNPEAIVGLIGATPLVQSDGWAVARRSMSLKTIRAETDTEPLRPTAGPLIEALFGAGWRLLRGDVLLAAAGQPPVGRSSEGAAAQPRRACPR